MNELSFVSSRKFIKKNNQNDTYSDTKQEFKSSPLKIFTGFKIQHNWRRRMKINTCVYVCVYIFTYLQYLAVFRGAVDVLAGLVHPQGHTVQQDHHHTDTLEPCGETAALRRTTGAEWNRTDNPTTSVSTSLDLSRSFFKIIFHV